MMKINGEVKKYIYASCICCLFSVLYNILTLDKPINVLCNDSFFSWVAILLYCILVEMYMCQALSYSL